MQLKILKTKIQVNKYETMLVFWIDRAQIHSKAQQKHTRSAGETVIGIFSLDVKYQESNQDGGSLGQHDKRTGTSTWTMLAKADGIEMADLLYQIWSVNLTDDHPWRVFKFAFFWNILKSS